MYTLYIHDPHFLASSLVDTLFNGPSSSSHRQWVPLEQMWIPNTNYLWRFCWTSKKRMSILFAAELTLTNNNDMKFNASPNVVLGFLHTVVKISMSNLSLTHTRRSTENDNLCVRLNIKIHFTSIYLVKMKMKIHHGYRYYVVCI